MKRLAVLAVIALVCVGNFHAQTTNASVTGRITDSSKGVIAAVDVSLVNSDTGIHYSGKTNDTTELTM